MCVYNANIRKIGKKKIYVFKNETMCLEEKTLEEILTDFSPLLKKMVNDIYSKQIKYEESKEDLLQTSNLELIKIYNSYDHEKKISFNHYAKKVLYKQFYCSAFSEQKKRQRINSLKLVTAKSDTFHNNDDLEISNILIDFENNIKKNNSNKYSKRDCLILKYKLLGMTQLEIGDMLHISQSTISRALNRLKERLDI